MSAALKAIHAQRRKLDLDDDTYRDLLERVTGKRSARDLSEPERRAVLDAMNGNGAPGARAKTELAGRYASVLRALWLTGYNLGVVADRRDTALIAFVERQTGISHTAWLREQADARRAIEGLKKWVEREGGVSLAAANPLERKCAVIRAQAARLAIAPPIDLDSTSDGQKLDAVASSLGARIRRAGKRCRKGHDA